MRFKTDENIPSEAVALLRGAGHDVASVPDESLGGCPDPKIASVCQDEERILITLDTDFSDIRTYRPADYRGLVVLRITRQSVPEIVRVLGRLLEVFESNDCRSQLWIVDENRIRVHT